MVLTSRDVDSIRRTLEGGGQLPMALLASPPSLAGAIEFVLTAASERYGTLAPVLRGEVPLHPVLTEVYRCWSKAHRPSETPFGTPPYEFIRFSQRDDQTGLQYNLYQQRFVGSVKNAGFDARFAAAMMSVLAEMSDNIVQHSRSAPGEFSGIIGYHVVDSYFALVIGDLGRGILASLKASQRWNALSGDSDALRAAVCRGASSRSGQLDGEGFRTVLKNLTDRNCAMRFRSGGACLTVVPTSEAREGQIMRSPFLSGFQITIMCALRGEPTEKEISEIRLPHSP